MLGTEVGCCRILHQVAGPGLKTEREILLDVGGELVCKAISLVVRVPNDELEVGQDLLKCRGDIHNSDLSDIRVYTNCF